jgi:large subunit ribosomal protein L30
MKPKLRVTQKKSTIGRQSAMSLTVRGLGLKGPGSSVVVDNTPSFRGAIKKVLALVEVEEVDRG